MAKKKKNKKQLPKPRAAKLATTLYALSHELPVYGEWLDDVEIAKIENDPVVLSSISKRKAATLKKQLRFICDDEAVAQRFESICDYTFRAQVLDTVYQGMGVFELNWHEHEGWWYPHPVERDYRAFSLLEEDLIYEFEPVDPRKVLHLTHRAKFNARLGRPLYDTLFWLRRFKAASMEFWMEFMERFGKPWVVGATDADKNVMAQELYAMLGGDVAVIEHEDTIDLKSPSEKGGFKEILSYLDDQIREAITGGNLTGNVTQGSYAAAQTHKQIGDEIAMADANLLSEAVEALISKFKTLNVYDGEITFTIEDPDDFRAKRAERDKTLSEMMGGRFAFTQEYITQTYGVQVEPSAAQSTVSAKTMPFSTKPALPHDAIDAALASIDTTEDEEAIMQVLERVFASASSYEEAYDSLVRALSDLDEATLLKHFERYIQNAMLYGNLEAGLEDDQA